MPVAIILPAVAGFAAASSTAIMSTALVAGMTTAIGATMSAVVVGAVAGAVVGGISAAVMDGDIGEGVLYGAVGGAVGGYLGGADIFSSGTSGVNFGAGEGVGTGLDGSAFGSNFITASPEVTGFANADLGIKAVSTAGNVAGNVGGGVVGSGGLLGGMSDMTQYALISGGADMLKGVAGGSASDAAAEQTAAQERINTANIAQRERESQTAYKINQENISSRNTELDKNIAQREVERRSALDEAIASRDRRVGTATGLTLSRKQKEVGDDEISQYLRS